MTVRFEVVAEVDRLRPAWSALARSSAATPFGYPGFFLAWSRAFAANRTAFAIAGFRRRELVFVLPAWHALGDDSTWNTLGAFRADYSEAVINAAGAAETARAFWTWLARAAPCRSAKIARMPADDSLARAAPPAGRRKRALLVELLRNFARSGRLRFTSSHVLLDHPYADRDEVIRLAARLSSQETRRKLNVLSRGGPVTYRVVRGSRDLAPLLDPLFAMHVANFASTDRRSQFEAAEERSFFEALVSDDDLADVVHMDVLAVADRPVAVHLGFQCARQVFWYKPAFDPEHAKGSPGRVLLANLFARAAGERSERVDLLKGTEPYKAEWSNRSRATLTTTLRDHTPLRRGPR